MDVQALMQNIMIPQFAMPTKQTEMQNVPTIKETPRAMDSVQRQTSGGADFVAKIKGSNEAMGFIATALKGLDAISNSSDPAKTAQSFNFNGKNILEAQTFDTTSGIVGVSVYLGDLNPSDPSFGECIAKSKSDLQDIKAQLASPVMAMKSQQERDLRSQATQGNPLMSKLNNILDGIEAGANRVGNQIF